MHSARLEPRSVGQSPEDQEHARARQCSAAGVEEQVGTVAVVEVRAAERFREEWRWLEIAADELSATIYEDQWDQLPSALARLMPRFADIKIKQMTRKPALWQGAYEKLLQGD